MSKDCSVSAKVNLGSCQGRDGRYPISEISATLSGDVVQMRCVTSRCHRGVNIAEFRPEVMDELAVQWLMARRHPHDSSELEDSLMRLKETLQCVKRDTESYVDIALKSIEKTERSLYKPGGRRKS